MGGPHPNCDGSSSGDDFPLCEAPSGLPLGEGRRRVDGSSFAHRVETVGFYSLCPIGDLPQIRH